MKHRIFSAVRNERVFNIAVFNTISDPAPKYASLSLDELKSILIKSTFSEDKGAVPLFSGSMFSGENRQKENALYSDLLIFDLDGKNYNYNKSDLELLFSEIKFFAYETYSSSHTFDEYRWRIIIPLAHAINTDEYDYLWEKIKTSKRLDADPSTKSINAIYYFPEHSESNTNPIFITNNKPLINPTEILSKARDYKPTRNALNTDTRLTGLSKKGEGALHDAFSIDKRLLDKNQFSTADLKNITSHPFVGLKLASLIGINVETCGISETRFKSKALKSVLPWHAKDDHPSCGIMIKEQGDDAGRVIFKSFKSEDAEHPFYDLHYIYACQQTGRRIDLAKWTKSTSLVWLSRALIDAGIIKPQATTIDTRRASLSDGATKLFGAMIRLSEAREMLEYYDTKEIVFSFSFAEIWCGTSRQTASKNFKELVDAGVINQIPIETKHRTVNGFTFAYRSISKSGEVTQKVNAFYVDETSSNVTEVIKGALFNNVSQGEELRHSGLHVFGPD